METSSCFIICMDDTITFYFILFFSHNHLAKVGLAHHLFKLGTYMFFNSIALTFVLSVSVECISYSWILE
ncbi:uncharacterized protein DS421_16g546370 [Arachis hypogaea]|nr:uncharacterized protein DS421_16g546370 [Arachis hypogaea]